MCPLCHSKPVKESGMLQVIQALARELISKTQILHCVQNDKQELKSNYILIIRLVNISLL